jgi:hypothetical protein
VYVNMRGKGEREKEGDEEYERHACKTGQFFIQTRPTTRTRTTRPTP